MNFKFQSFSSALLMIALFTLPFISCSDDDPAELPEQSIAGIAAADEQFSTLVSALDRVGLTATLDGSGNFTVFAPTNAAFQAAGIDLNALSDEELKEVLLYHVLGAEVLSASIADGQTYVTTASTYGPGATQLSLLIEKSASGVKLNGSATVTSADISANNGVIHVIDQVLLPLDVVGHAAANANFSELVGALGAASGDLVTVLSADGPFTVFAPLNSAFEAISNVTSGLTADQLAKVLTYHVVANANVVSGNLSDGMTVTTVNGENFTVNINGGNVTLTDANGSVANVILTDVQATNGVIHVLDKVIIPSNL